MSTLKATAHVCTIASLPLSQHLLCQWVGASWPVHLYVFKSARSHLTRGIITLQTVSPSSITINLTRETLEMPRVRARIQRWRAHARETISNKHAWATDLIHRLRIWQRASFCWRCFEEALLTLKLKVKMLLTKSTAQSITREDLQVSLFPLP